jgi:protein-S-isoprenylcysteine O-methyltransferase Ste14
MCAWRASERWACGRRNMTDLNKKALKGVFGFVLTIALCVFFPAWTFHYWEAWVWICLLFVALLGITLYLMKNDPRLLERRLRAGPSAETQKSQKVGQLFGAIAFVATLVIPSLDHRFAWSSVPVPFVIGGEVLVILGLLTVFRVFRENTFTSATIEIAPEQRVVSSGPYSAVRHPMYLGALIMIFGIPLALGSWWGLATIAPITLVIVRRVRDEEKLLARNLTGYLAYRVHVRYRLLPFVW